jgi:hypothetical protein
MSTNLTCKFCNNNFKSVSNLNYHIKTSKKCISQRSNTDSNIEIRYLECKYCSKKFTQANHLTNHLLVCKEKDSKLLDDLNKQIIELKNIIKEKDDIIKDLIKKTGNQSITINQTNTNNTNNQILNIKYEELKDKMLNNLVPFTDENILELVGKMNHEKMIYFNNFDSEKNFISEFIKTIKCMVISTDLSRNKLLIKDKDGEVVSIVSEKFVLYIFNISREKLLEIVTNAIIFLKKEENNMTEEDFVKCLYNLQVIKSVLNGKVEKSDTITSIANSLSKNVELLPSITQYKKLNNKNLNKKLENKLEIKELTDNNNIKNNKKIKKVRNVKNADSDSESD